MSMHTPEPWRAEWRLCHSVTNICADVDPREPTEIDGMQVIQFGATYIAECHGSLRDGGDEANAARIVACVNYCAGMTAQQLTEDSAEIVREDRDRLLAALSELQANPNDPRAHRHALDVLAGRAA